MPPPLLPVSVNVVEPPAQNVVLAGVIVALANEVPIAASVCLGENIAATKSRPANAKRPGDPDFLIE